MSPVEFLQPARTARANEQRTKPNTASVPAGSLRNRRIQTFATFERLVEGPVAVPWEQPRLFRVARLFGYAHRFSLTGACARPMTLGIRLLAAVLR